MNRLADMAILVLLALALVHALSMAKHAPMAPPAGLPLSQPDDAPGALSEPGEVRRVVSNQLAVVGEHWTIEDLARGVALLESGGIPQVQPLSEEAAASVRASLQEADKSRGKLTEIQGEVRQTEDKLTAAARQLAATLTAEQRAWILEHRDRISVTEVEQRYWDRLLQTEGAAP